jgi:iron complex outermembrane receptor protein
MPAPRTPSAIGSLTVLSMSLAAIWNPALAQSDGSGASPEARAKAEKGIETVVVTAQKRSQSIKEVPVAITAVNAAQLERAGVKDIGDLAKTAASLEFGDQAAGGAGGSASIRGIGTAVFTLSAESSVGVVVDGVPQGATASGLMLDLARVEVLRGPQGTLFGKNASAGVLNMVTQEPIIGDSGGSVSLEYKGKHGEAVRATGNVPLNDISALRIAGVAERNKGVYHNVLKRGQRHHNGGVRLRYLLKPNRDVSVNLIGEAANTRSENAVFFAPAVAYASNTAGDHRPAGRIRLLRRDRLEDQQPGLLGRRRTHAHQGARPVRPARLDPAERQHADLDHRLPHPQAGPGKRQHRHVEHLRQGLQPRSVQERAPGLAGAADRLARQAGARIRGRPVLRRFDERQEFQHLDPAESRAAFAAGAALDRHRQRCSTPDMTTKALFGQATWHLTDATGLIAGLRYTRDSVSSTFTQSAW